MSTNTVNNKRIAKNTLLLYMRMLFTIAVGLYTSRVVLSTLGISDYGIQNVVGGIVAMLGFLNSAMTSASQRFISFELGKQDVRKSSEVFSTSVIIHILIAIIILILAETIGLWFLNTHMEIDADRMTAANWVYQSAIFSFMLTVISVPYNASIVAHEHMKAFAYISILEVCLKLLAVFMLVLTPYDKLISYSILLLLIATIVRITYGIYCKRKFEECSFHFTYNKELFRKMFVFAGWSIVGNLGFATKDQGSNIVLNLFYGTTLNAARGIAMQINGIISSFSNNFIMAINPQITKQYAANEIDESIRLVYTGCRYSCFLLSLISIPVLINIDYILELWLEDVPQYTSQFLYFVLFAAIISSMAGPIVTALQATGNIMMFQITICLIMLCEVPLTYLILYLGYPPYYSMFAAIIVAFVGLFARIIILKHQVPQYSLRYFTFNIILKNILLMLLCYLIAQLIRNLLPVNFLNLIVTSVISVLISGMFIYLLGMSTTERSFIKNKIFSIISKNQHL